MTFAATAGAALPIIIGAFIVAALVALFVTPLVRRVSRNLRILDHPDERRTHGTPLPRGGGIAVALAFLAVGGGLVMFGGALPGMPGLRGIDSTNLLGLFGGGVLAVVIGAIDDRYDLRARWQFLGQLVLAGVAIVTGITVAFIGDPFGPDNIQFIAPIGIAFTVVWVVGMINSLNFIDGLDGLSTGIALDRGGDAGAPEPHAAGEPATRGGPVLRPRRWPARIPALELPSGGRSSRARRA